MSKLSEKQEERSRKNYSIIMQGLASVGNKAVANAIGCDESTISRMKPEKFQEFSDMLAVMGLKVVSENMKCFNQKDIETILHQAKRWMEHVQSVEQLWDD